MGLRKRTAAFGAAIVACGMWAPICLGQSGAGKQETRGYGYGVGRITWTLPRDFEAGFAVPHWTAGPRVKCWGGRGKVGREYECEIQVGPRDITISREERLKQLEGAIASFLRHAANNPPKLQVYGAGAGSVSYFTLEDSRTGEFYRYMTFGYAHKGPAVIKFEARTGDPSDLQTILSIVSLAKAEDALEMWAYRFQDYKAVCEERFPAFTTLNEAAFASSPFAGVDVVGFFMRQRPTRTRESTQVELEGARRAFATEFDGRPLDEKRSFCESFPRLISEAAKDVQ